MCNYVWQIAEFEIFRREDYYENARIFFCLFVCLYVYYYHFLWNNNNYRYEIFFCSFSDEETLSAIMRRKINAPNRLLLTDECYGSLVLGFPDLESSENEVFCWHRPKYAREYGWSGLFGKSIFVKENFQVFSLPLPPPFEFQVFRKREMIFKISFCF